MNDTLESVFDESGDEEEQDAIVSQVLDEIGIEITGKVNSSLDFFFNFVSLKKYPIQADSQLVTFIASVILKSGLIYSIRHSCLNARVSEKRFLLWFQLANAPSASRSLPQASKATADEDKEIEAMLANLKATWIKNSHHLFEN